MKRARGSVPDFSREQRLLRLAQGQVAGVDEVGRGPLAGPITAAAVILDPDNIPAGLNDSKTLSRAKREALAAQLHEVAQVAIFHVDVEEIDRINILQASHLAMRQAIVALHPAIALIDGNRLPHDLPCPARTIVRGDALCLSIAAASIVAKVSRDRLMVDLAQQHPPYGWERNAGYGTLEHRLALQKHGPTPHHRRTFAPLRNMLWQA